MIALILASFLATAEVDVRHDDAERFPNVAVEQVWYISARVSWLRAACSLGETAQLQYGPLLREAERYEELYSLLDAARYPDHEMSDPARCLERLRGLIGYEAYYAGRLPELPLWMTEVPCSRP